MAEKPEDPGRQQIKVISVSWDDEGIRPAQAHETDLPPEPSRHEGTPVSPASPPDTSPETVAEQAFSNRAVVEAMSGTRGNSSESFGPGRYSGKVRWFVATVLFSLTVMAVSGVYMYLAGGGIPVFGRLPRQTVTGGKATAPAGAQQAATEGGPAAAPQPSGMLGYPARAKAAACAANLRSVDSAIQVYFAEYGSWPSSLSAVAPFTSNPIQCPENNAPYAYDSVNHRAKCPNGHTYLE